MSLTRRCGFVAVTFTLVTLVAISSTHAGKIYWSGNDALDPAIWRANLNGGHPELLFDLLSIPPLYIALDRTRGHYYMLLGGLESGAGIFRFNMHDNGNGGNVVRIVEVEAYGVAVDSVSAKLYWTHYAMIRRANLDGSNVESLPATTGEPRGIALDPAGGKLYWTQFGADHVMRADLDGENREVLVTEEENQAHGIALDLQAGKLYWSWSNNSAGEIRRANLDGSNPETVLSTDVISGQIAIDPVPDGADVPALSARGLAVLVLVMLVLSAAVLRSRRPRQS
jgi:hypothetical protein